MKFSFEGSLSEWQALLGSGQPRVPFEGVPYTVFPVPDGDGPPEGLPTLPTIPEDQTQTESPEAVLSRLPKVTKESRAAAWSHFVYFCTEWIRGFEQEGVPQPDRGTLMTELGQGRWPIPVLVMAYEELSLQRLVQKALVEGAGLTAASFASEDEYLDFIGRVAATMVQISHMGFPDLQGTMDFSERWRRTAA